MTTGNVHFWPRRRNPTLRGFFRNQRRSGIPRLRPHYLHFLPVVAEFLAAVKASHVRTRAPGYGGSTRTTSYRDRKTVARMSATEHRIHQLRKHRVLPQSKTKKPKQKQKLKTKAKSKAST